MAAASRERRTVRSAIAAAYGTQDPEVIEVGPQLRQVAPALFERLGRRPLPTAIFALTSIATLGSLMALSQRGLAVPEEVSLMGFDDYEWMQVVHPAISAVRQPVAELARAAWQRLVARLAGDTAPPERVRLACSLELRSSTAAPVATHRSRRSTAPP